jgi:hypothetical protein
MNVLFGPQSSHCADYREFTIDPDIRQELRIARVTEPATIDPVWDVNQAAFGKPPHVARDREQPP